MYNYFSALSYPGGFGYTSFFGAFMLIMPLLIIWSLVWKGMALWKAARLGKKEWFVALLILNTLGILEILYIYVFSEKKK